MSPRVLLVTCDRNLTDRLSKSLFAFAGDTFTIECVDRLSDATQRLKRNDGVDAVMMDWDLPATRGFETLLVLMGAAPELPIIILGDDPNLLQQMNLVEHGAQDYLLKRRLDPDTLIGMVHSAIARKSRERILFCDKQRAQVTLNSIGDAVLSTDADWRVAFLNPVAERLMGWTHAEASGQPLTEIFQVIDAATREPIVPWLGFGVGTERTVILPPNCVLLRRDGHELPIEDSAAPIHDRDGHVAGLVVVFRGVSEAQPTMAQRTTHLAGHHIPASLPNRGLSDEVHGMEKRWHGKESRWGDRVRVNIPVHISANGSSGEGCMKNLSLSGALMKIDVDLGPHALVHVYIKISSPSQRAVAITAYVSRKATEGIGVEWCEFAPTIVKDLLRSPSIPLPS